MNIAIQVKKKDGQLEDFNFLKIYRSVMAAGLPEDRANTVTNQVQDWAESMGDVVSTMEIKAKVIELLGDIDPDVAQNYKTYKKTG